MEKAELSKIYGGACNRMHEAVTVLYEALHDYDRVSEYRRWLLIEADLVREAVREYNEEVDRQHREA